MSGVAAVAYKIFFAHCPNFLQRDGLIHPCSERVIVEGSTAVRAPTALASTRITSISATSPAMPSGHLLNGIYGLSLISTSGSPDSSRAMACGINRFSTSLICALDVLPSVTQSTLGGEPC